MQKNSFSSGRTIVEMIAVISIMGVLTYGVFFTFSYLKSRHQANNIVQDLNYYYLEAENVSPAPTGFSERLVGPSGSKGVFSKLGVQASSRTLELESEVFTGFNIKFSNVPAKTCVQILKSLPEYVKVVTIGDVDYLAKNISGLNIENLCGVNNEE